MDFQNRVGNKKGTAGLASDSQINVERRKRLHDLILVTTQLLKDPYFFKNHIGLYECKLCLTIHNNEASYIAHTNSKKHQNNLAKRK